MDYLDGIDRALESGDLAEERRQVYDRLGKQFIKYSQRAGLDMIAPQPGDPVLDGHHRIEEIVPECTEYPHGTVAILLSPGYRRGEHVLRLAKIKMAGE